jgi:ankyrin repeat protein
MKPGLPLRLLAICFFLGGGVSAGAAEPAEAPQAQSKQTKEAADPEMAPADIFAAAKAGNLEAVKKFLEDNPALLNAKTKLGDTALHWAASCRQVEVVRFLLSKSPDLEARNITGSTPLHVACRAGNKAIVELLIAAKAQVNAKSGDEDEETALHIAVRKNDIETAQVLLEHKADVQAKTAGGRTPMDLATKNGRSTMIKLLKKYGAADAEEE